MLVIQKNCDNHEQTYYNGSLSEYETKELLKLKPP